MKKLKKIEKRLTNGPNLSIYSSSPKKVSREYFVLRKDVFDFLGIFNSTNAEHKKFAELQLTNED